ncbi:murein transglycosylase A [Thauera linaloolentis]|uniref:peptidoglycan lytic exotransglycosylase n=1 Tax=Thauera linaloolentis (strain DSM 12138 / JCM 21573 / CCUG 41526 / CIP 105981 / IAM 15112 / NBRC 102519 / 47Lol) TaxID=1123367 RepID=N6Y4R9_THAL4|nr:MltA domain-containing protein [Thauera linaloolentis 47Lol = DSM 12138]
MQASWSSVAGWSEDDPAAAWPALLASCSKLARQPNWKPVCDAASALGSAPGSQQARRYFEQHFVPWQLLGSGPSAEGLVTGYYEPLIRGSRSRSGQYAWPIHGVPADMLTIELGDVYPELKSLRLRGRIVGNKILPYWTREQVQERGAQLPAPVLLWADDPIDLFFLQVQGSGRVQLPDGKTVRIGYADQNGHPYQSIGRWLVAKGELSLDQASMDGIKRWARDNPDRLREMLNANPSYVFFRELPVSDAGPVGALSVPLSEGRSIAIDPRYVPLGAPVFLATTHPLSTRPLSRLVLAQDTGSAIKGAVRADFFWGFGEKAGREAGRMRQQGRMWLLLPKGMQPPRR